MQSLDWTIETAAATDPITTAEAKTHARVTTSAEDTLIGGYIAEATIFVQNWLNRQLVTATLTAYPKKFPAGGTFIELPRPPLSSISAVRYVDTSGDTQTLTSTVYQSDANSFVGRFALARNQAWPAVRGGVLSPIEIDFVCGYGVASAVPENFKSMIKLLVAHRIVNRDPLVIGMIARDLQLSLNALVGQERNYRF